MAARKRNAGTPTGAAATQDDAPGTGAPEETGADEIAPALVLPASLAEESEHEEITRAQRVYVDEMRATDEHGTTYAIQREQRADGTQGAREIAKVVSRQGTESRAGLRFLSEYGAAARAFRAAGVFVFPRFLTDLTSEDLSALLSDRESESEGA